GNRPVGPRAAQKAPTIRPGKESQAISNAAISTVVGRLCRGENPTAMVRNHTATAPTAQLRTFSADVRGPRMRWVVLRRLVRANARRALTAPESCSPLGRPDDSRRATALSGRGVPARR